MYSTMYYLIWVLSRIMSFAAACFLFMLDRKNVKRMRANNQHAGWYQRGLFLCGWVFLIPLIGADIPQLLISLLLFHGTVLPTNPDFDYQLSIHSLSFFIWLAIFAYGINIVLVIYLVYLGVRSNLSQRK